MAIIVENLSKRYGEQWAIRDLSFRIEKGEVVGFLGPNGAGKSTTMKILTCFLPPSGGSARIDDYNVVEHSREVRRRIGYLPEHNPLYLEMYVREYLTFAAELYGIKGKEVRTRVEDLIEKTGLTRESRKKIGQLSKGYRQRVGLAQALIHDPDVLILDEPTGGLDPNQILEIRSLIKSIGESKTVLFSSHILSEVEAVAHRVLIIHLGSLIADAAIHELPTLFSGDTRIKIGFEQSGFDFTGIKNLPSVSAVETLNDKTFVVVCGSDTDVRKALYDESVRQGNSILLLEKQEAGLEEIFRKVTQTPPQTENTP